jgi:hypothetical protein
MNIVEAFNQHNSSNNKYSVYWRPVYDEYDNYEADIVLILFPNNIFKIYSHDIIFNTGGQTKFYGKEKILKQEDITNDKWKLSEISFEELNKKYNLSR